MGHTARGFLLNQIILSVSCCSRSTQSPSMGSLLFLTPAAVAAWRVSTCCSNLGPSRSSGITLLRPFMRRSREVTFRLWVKLTITRWGMHLWLILEYFSSQKLVCTGTDNRLGLFPALEPLWLYMGVCCSTALQWQLFSPQVTGSAWRSFWPMRLTLTKKTCNTGPHFMWLACTRGQTVSRSFWS